MILLPLAAAALALQHEDLVEYRTLALPRRGSVAAFGSTTPGSDPFAVQTDGTFLLASSAERRGRIARMWLEGGHPRTKLWMNLDWQRANAYEERIGAAFEDGRAPFLSIATFTPEKAAGARVSYPDVHYQRALRVTASSKIGAYEIELVEQEAADVAPFPVAPKTQDYELPAVDVNPGEAKTWGVVPDGEGTIEELVIVPVTITDADFHDVRLRIFVDGEAEPGIDVSLERCFARESRKLAFPGYAVSNTEKEMRIRVPIPFASGCKAELQNVGTRAVKIKGSAKLNRDPLIPDTRRLRIREYQATAAAGAPAVLGAGTGAGHILGFTAKLETDPAKLAGGRVEIESDGRLAYRSVSLASAFDGGPDFGKSPYATVGAGVASVAEKSITAFCFRVTRAIPFEMSYRLSIAPPAAGSLQVSGALFVYEAPRRLPGTKTASGPASATASRPASGPASSPSSRPGSVPASSPASRPASAPAH